MLHSCCVHARQPRLKAQRRPEIAGPRGVGGACQLRQAEAQHPDGRHQPQRPLGVGVMHHEQRQNEIGNIDARLADERPHDFRLSQAARTVFWKG